MNHPNLEMRSDVVQELLSYVPHWIVRWGSSFLCLIFTMLIGIAHFISYPDVIQGPVLLTTMHPPIRLHSRCNGMLDQMHVENHSYVAKNTPLVTLQDPVSSEAIQHLKTFLIQVTDDLQKMYFSPAMYANLEEIPFGTMQSSYHQLHNAIQDYMYYVQSPYYSDQLTHLQAQIEYEEKLVPLFQQQIACMEQQLEHACTKYTSYQQLYKQKQLPKIEFLEKESNYMQLKQSYAEQKKQGLNHQMQLANTKQQHTMLSFACKEKQEKLTLGIRTLVRTLQNEIHEWESSYVIKAPIAGKVCYIEPWHMGMSIKQHQELFAIIPNDNAYVAYVQLSGQGFGKIKIDQKVMVKLFPYPHHEYGYLKGVVQAINNMPHKNQYSVTITLTQDLKTTYNKELPFKPDMEGIAEILTEELSLLQRIFYSNPALR